MTTITDGSVTYVTDDRGDPMEGIDLTEPQRGSVVLTNGVHGTAFQRWFNDGLWHRDGWSPVTWEFLLQQRNLVLVYDAPVRDEQR